MIHVEEAGTGENTPWLSSANSWISNSREISSPTNTENHPYTSQKWGQITLLYLSTGLCEAYENGHTILHLFLTSFCDIKCEYSCILPWHLYLNFFSGNSSSLSGSFYDSKKVKEIQIFPFGFLWWFINDSEKKKNRLFGLENSRTKFPESGQQMSSALKKRVQTVMFGLD